MRWILFYVFIGIFVSITILTILALFWGFGKLQEHYKTTLFTTFIIESVIAMITLFYTNYNLVLVQKGHDKIYSKPQILFTSSFERIVT